MQDYNPKLCDFGSTRGGIFPNKRTYSGHDILGCYGCTDIAVFNTGIQLGYLVFNLCTWN